MRVVDLGAAPGGWSQVAAREVKSGEGRGRVIGIDLLEIDPIEGVEFRVMDFHDADAPQRLKAWLGGSADGVMSDMAANATGHRKTDHLRIVGARRARHRFRVRNPRARRLLSGQGPARRLRRRAARDAEARLRLRPPRQTQSQPRRQRRALRAGDGVQGRGGAVGALESAAIEVAKRDFARALVARALSGDLVGEAADLLVLHLDALDRDAVLGTDPINFVFARASAAHVADLVVADEQTVRHGRPTAHRPRADGGAPEVGCGRPRSHGVGEVGDGRGAGLRLGIRHAAPRSPAPLSSGSSGSRSDHSPRRAILEIEAQRRRVAAPFTTARPRYISAGTPTKRLLIFLRGGLVIIPTSPQEAGLICIR